jgi:probable phosphoglycerate mutase
MRHGLSEFNKKGIVNGQLDDDLSPEGKKQTREDTSLVPKSIRHIYSSPLRRGKETAEIFNDKLHSAAYFSRRT